MQGEKDQSIIHDDLDVSRWPFNDRWIYSPEQLDNSNYPNVKLGGVFMSRMTMKAAKTIHNSPCVLKLVAYVLN